MQIPKQSIHQGTSKTIWNLGVPPTCKAFNLWEKSAGHRRLFATAERGDKNSWGEGVPSPSLKARPAKEGITL